MQLAPTLYHKKTSYFSMGVDHGGNANCPPSDFVMYKKERSVAFNYTPKSVFGRSRAPDSAGGAHNAPPARPPSRLGRGHPSPYTTPHGTDPPSALAICVPQNSSQIYTYFRFQMRCSVSKLATVEN